MTPITIEGETGRLGAHLRTAAPIERAAAVLEAVGRRLGQRIAVDTLPLLRADLLRGPDEWNGYLPWSDGWLGIAFPDAAAQGLFDDLVTRHRLCDQAAAEAASLLQSFGIAALPAKAAPAVEAPAIERSESSDRTKVLRGAKQSAFLVGQRVVDMGRLIAAPLAAQILRELGADVIRVRPKHQEEMAGDVSLDLSSPSDRLMLANLVAEADLLIENVSVAAGQRLTQLFDRRPPRGRVSIRGFTPQSPRRHWRGYGFLFEAAECCGYAPSETAHKPVPASGVPILDRTAGLLAAALGIRCLVESTGESTHHVMSLEAVAKSMRKTGPVRERSANHEHQPDSRDDRGDVSRPDRCLQRLEQTELQRALQ